MLSKLQRIGIIRRLGFHRIFVHRVVDPEFSDHPEFSKKWISAHAARESENVSRNPSLPKKENPSLPEKAKAKLRVPEKGKRGFPKKGSEPSRFREVRVPEKGIHRSKREQR
jgi:hypothetical protein